MNADSVFQIGKDHTVCEDYALAGIVKDTAFAIVCDGCSASPDVDFGARVLALAAKERIFGQFPLDLYDFGAATIREANEVAKRFPMLHPQFLDATLLVASVTEKQLTAYIYGDGVLVHRTKDAVKSVHIHLTSGAPDYLSYHLDARRAKAYDALPENKKEVWTSYDGVHDYKPFAPFSYTCPVEEGDVISVITDGINSFRKENNESVDWKVLVDEFTGFKNFEGQFVQRRIGAFKRKFTKDNWHHFDDISIASIVV